MQRILRRFGRLCFVALGLLVMGLAFFGGPAQSEPPVAAIQDWEKTDAHGAPKPSESVEPWGDSLAGAAHLDGGGGGARWDLGKGPSESSPARLHRHQFFLSRHG